MFKYENDICEYIRSYIKLNTFNEQDWKINILFKEYLNKNNLVLVSTKTLETINNLNDLRDYNANLKCPMCSCIGLIDMKCVVCFLDQNLNDGKLKLIERKDSNV